MKTYITRINGWSLRDKSHYMQHMVAEAAHQLGCREMGIFRYYAEDEGGESLGSRLDGIIAGINRGDLVICQFPTGNGMRFEHELVYRLKAYGARIAVLIHELEALADEGKKSLLGSIVELYNQAEVLIVPTYAMRQWLLDNGIHKGMKFVVQEMWDYTVREPLFNTPTFRKEIYFTDSEGFEGMADWNDSVPLNLYNASAGQGNVRNLGEREPYQLLSELNRGGGFGLVWYRDTYSRQYMEKSNSFSLARYLAAGMPVIVPAGGAHQTLVEMNHLGLAVNTLEEATALIERMTEGEYREYIKAVEQFAPAVQNGYFTKKCLCEAMQAFYRKDAGRLPLPERVYETGECVFRSSVLRESYGGNVAFSWDFQGEAEGFLIYDTKGALLGNTRDLHQHYLLLKKLKSENGVIIKAYLETLKGKLVLAESEPAYLQEGSCDSPKVSLIMPAFNAQDYIVRSIDTALAQTLPDLELIIVDDGSTDRTSEIIDWYARHYRNIAVIHQKNRGVAAARNTGIVHAKGNYIGFLDSDDMMRPDMTAKLYETIRKNHCDIAVTSVYRMTDYGYDKFIQYPMKEDTAVTIDEFFLEYYIRECGYGAVIWNKLYRASLVKSHFFPEILSEDEGWTPCVLSYADRVCYLDACGYEYDRISLEGSLADKVRNRSKEERFEIYKKVVMFYLKNGNQDRLDLLKALAKKRLLENARVYVCDEYEKLWQEIA